MWYAQLAGVAVAGGGTVDDPIWPPDEIVAGPPAERPRSRHASGKTAKAPAGPATASTASGTASTASGRASTASGPASTASGLAATASDTASTASDTVDGGDSSDEH